MEELMEVYNKEVTTMRGAKAEKGGKTTQVLEQKEEQVRARVKLAEMTKAKEEAGWRVYGTNSTEMKIEEVVWGYRGEYRIEDDFARLKGKALSLTPMMMQDEERIRGLVMLLSVCLRVLNLLEWKVRKELSERKEKLKGVYPGQKGRSTATPSAELLLRVFRGIAAVQIEVNGKTSWQMQALSPVQKKLLDYWGFPPDLYSSLVDAVFL
jgi:transposase